MAVKRFLISLFLFFSGAALYAQSSCTLLGQNPATAFPVCGVDTFNQVSVPLCGNHSILVPNCPGSYADANPYWYQFTCYTSGTLGFLITPLNLGDDYDWQIFDITGHSPNDVFTGDPALVVAGNWSGTYGLTGASAGGAPIVQCASDPADNISAFSAMPKLIAGHTYLLLVSHFTNTQSGYQLTFGGGTGSITDPNIPALQSATLQCDAVTLTIKLSKKVRCSSLAKDGSDFSFSSPLASIVSASGINCNGSFDLDSLNIILNNPLPAGNYTVTAKMGSDGNTLLDDCHNSVVVGDNVSFAFAPFPPTPLDSITPIGCAPNQLQLVFSTPIQCNSIAADGSDFVITGPSPVSIQSASGNCNANFSNVVLINLSSPIPTAGTYQVTLVKGSDGNTLIDACTHQTPAGSTITLTGYDTVSAAFSYQLFYGCVIDSIQFSESPKNGINQWQWTFDSSASILQNPMVTYAVFGEKHAQLVVSNGVCTDTAAAVIVLDNTLKAAFVVPDQFCPTDKVLFQDSSIGNNIVSWNWNYGDGFSSTAQNPLPHTYPPSTTEMKYTVSLIIGNSAGCADTSTEIITKLRSCYITVPTAFTPNGDGVNDYLYPLNAYKALNLQFSVYNRYGQLIFQTKDWTNKWDGTFNGKPQDSGTYVWMLRYTDSGKNYFLKGTTVLIR